MSGRRRAGKIALKKHVKTPLKKTNVSEKPSESNVEVPVHAKNDKGKQKSAETVTKKGNKGQKVVPSKQSGKTTGEKRTLSQIKNSVEKIRNTQTSAVSSAIGSIAKRKSARAVRPSGARGGDHESEVSDGSALSEDSDEDDAAGSPLSSDGSVSDVEVEVEVGDKGKSGEAGKNSKSKKFRDPELSLLLQLCFKYYGIIEGNLSSADSGLTREKKDDTWKFITQHINR